MMPSTFDDRSAPAPVPAALSGDDLDALDDILDALRARLDETPQWEFCDGFLVALACSRRRIDWGEALPMLLGDGERIDWPADDGAAPLLPMFVDAAQQATFLALWQRRFDEVVQALDAPVQTLDDPRTLEPEVMDVRGALLALPEADRPPVDDGDAIPSFAQVWALGFMFAVENWPEDWAPPREREAAQWLDDALQSIVALTEDDRGVPSVNMAAEDAPPSVSEQRLEQYGDAIWAVYDLRVLWKSLGPRVDPLRKAPEPGRNDPCWCGSGKKFKKCHGAA